MRRALLWSWMMGGIDSSPEAAVVEVRLRTQKSVSKRSLVLGWMYQPLRMTLPLKI